MALNQFTGSFAIINYSTKIFSLSGSDLDPNISTIIIGILQIIGTYISTLLVDRCGRKILLTISSFGMCLGYGTIGLYSFLYNNMNLTGYNWIPIWSISFVIFMASIGVNPLVFVVLVEILPDKV